MMSNEIDPLLADVVALTQSVGVALSAFYENPAHLNITQKFDDSPVTAADLAAHHHIVAGLAQLTPHIPVLSEESTDHEARHQWSRFWLVDPLDGTREFIERTGEFSVNIALIDDGQVIMAVIGVPVKGTVYAVGGAGLVWHVDATGWHRRLPQLKPITAPWQMAISRQAGQQRADRYQGLLNQLTVQQRVFETVHAGSAYKFCLMVDGAVDVYPRLHPTSEWDTAAGQGLLEALGGGVYDLQGRPFRYNQRKGILNGSFIALRDRTWLPDVLALIKTT